MQYFSRTKLFALMWPHFRKIFSSSRIGHIKKNIFVGRGFRGGSDEKMRRMWLRLGIVWLSFLSSPSMTLDTLSKSITINFSVQSFKNNNKSSEEKENYTYLHITLSNIKMLGKGLFLNHNIYFFFVRIFCCMISYILENNVRCIKGHVRFIKGHVRLIKCHVRFIKCHVRFIKWHVRFIKCHVWFIKCHVRFKK